MVIARRTGDRSRGPMLLALVFGVVLVLIGVTASALVAIASVHMSNATLSGVVSRDAALVQLLVNGSMRLTDFGPDGPSSARSAQLTELLASMADSDGIVRFELRGLDGRVISSNAEEVIGLQTGWSAAMEAASRGEPSAELIEPGGQVTAAGGLDSGAGLVQQYLPIIDEGRRPVAVVAVWRDASALIASLVETRRDVMLVTVAAGLLLAAVLFLVFRSSQARLSNQHRQLLDATKRDALTGMLNHGAVVALLAEEIEVARRQGTPIGVALVDVDNFRLFNDTHGHAAADEVLLRVAEVVGAEAAGGHAARYGPDEFLIALPGANAADLESAVRRLRDALEDVSVQFGDSERLPVSVSAGICAYPTHASSVTELLSVAALALGEARASGGDGIRVAGVGDDDRLLAGSFDVLQGLVIAVDTKDRYTKRHSEDVARYAVFLARRMGLDDEMIRTIHLAGLLHDIGKIGIPDGVLRKPSKLTADEYGMFQQHVALGDAIVRDVPNVDVVRAGIRHHHERWDGNGYLDGLEGDAIPLIARVLAVADAFSAMTTTRPYRKALAVDEALKRLGDGAGSQLQEDLVVAFIDGIETDADAPLPGEDPTHLWRPELWVA